MNQADQELLERDRTMDGWERQARFEDEFEQAKILADQHDMRLKQFNNAMHYQLFRPGEWILNIYPNTRRLYSDRHLPAPYVGPLAVFTLTNIINAMVAKEQA